MRLAILGGGGHGAVVADMAECIGWEAIVFFDDAWPNRSWHSQWPVQGDSVILAQNFQEFDGVFVAIGNNLVRQEMLERLSSIGAPIVSLIHPSAIVSNYATVNVGTAVMPRVVVNAASKIGKGVILNTGCCVDHDCVVGDYSHISPGVSLAGGVTIGAESWIGIGSSVSHCINVGRRTVVGAGAAVVSDLAEGVTAVGVPAKPISR